MIIDVHTHVFPDNVASRARSSLQSGSDLEWHGDGTVAGLLGEMDRAGIDLSVIQPVATNPGSVAKVNEWAASLCCERIVPFGAMHPDLEDPAAEIEHIRSLGMKGFKLHPEFQEFEPDEARLAPLLSAAEKAGLIILFHAGADPAYQSVRGNAEAFVRMLEAYPSLTVILAHLGGFNHWEQVREHLVGRHVYLDTAYTLGHLPDDEFVAIVREHGVERVLFGTDAPWTDSTRELAHLRSLGFNAEELDRLLWRNTAELLEMAPAPETPT